MTLAHHTDTVDKPRPAAVPDDAADSPGTDRGGARAHLQAHLDDADTTEDSVPTSRTVPAALRTVAWPKSIVRAHSPASPVTGKTGGKGDRRPWEIRDAADGGGAEILLYDEIGGWGIWAEELAQDLARISASEITVRVNSPGGDVFDGVAIMNSLIAHPANITIRVDGLAASIASVICLAGDRVVMGHSAQMMVHNASTFAWGDANEMDATADLLRQISGVIAEAYADRCGTPVEEWQARMDAETWLTAQECVALGLADEIAALPARRGLDPDAANTTEPEPKPVPAAASGSRTLRPAAILDTSGTAPTGPTGEAVVPEPPAADPGGHPDAAILGQALAWWTAVDQQADTACARIAAALGVPNPDTDPAEEPVPLPAGVAGLAQVLGMLTAVDTIVDGAQVVMSAHLGVPNPDPDVDPEDPGHGEPDDTGPGPDPIDEWTALTAGLSASPTGAPSVDDLLNALKEAAL